MSEKMVSLAVLSRPGKKPMRNTPATIEVTSSATVDDAKRQIAKAAGGRDFNRIAIMDPSTQSILKDRNAILSQQSAIMKEGKIMIKDLGPQISWKTVFVIEYAGPIFIHLAMVLLRPYLYKSVRDTDLMSTAQNIAYTMIILHFIKRELETLFVHKFSASTMPFFNVYKNSSHYWGLAGLNIAAWIYSPYAAAAKPMSDPTTALCVYIGSALYIAGEFLNLNSHINLSNLRSPGGTERGIPKGLGFDMVTCPNYLFETVAWTGILLVTRSLGVLVFIVVAFYQMQVWAEGKENRYRMEFGSAYKPKAFPIIPGLPFVFSKPKKLAK